FGPILPRMRSRVRADEMFLPVGRRASLIVGGERHAVVNAFISEERSELVDLRRAADENVPEVVTTLVPHVSKKRSIRLVHRGPPAFSLGIVGFRDVDGDHT